MKINHFSNWSLSTHHWMNPVLWVFVGFILLLLMSGCTSTNNSVKPSPVITRIPCAEKIKAPFVNIYSDAKYGPLIPKLNTIFTDWKKGNENAKQNQIKTVFGLLEKQAKEWSRSHTVQLSNNNYIRITIIFLSPDLIRTAILNNLFAIASTPEGKDKFEKITDFNNYANQRMTRLINRNEYVFLVVLSTTNGCKNLPGNCAVSLQINDLLLIDGEDNAVRAMHDDHLLERQIDMTKGGASGFVFFGMGVENEEKKICEWFLNPEETTTLTLGMPGMNGIDKISELSFGFHYAPLISDDTLTVFSIEDQSSRNMGDLTSLTKNFQPPNPKQADDGGEDENYWPNMARFIWQEIYSGLLP